jgi:hypothetical protein
MGPHLAREVPVGRVAGLRDVALTVMPELEDDGADETPTVVLEDLGRRQPLAQKLSLPVTEPR